MNTSILFLIGFVFGFVFFLVGYTLGKIRGEKSRYPKTDTLVGTHEDLSERRYERATRLIAGFHGRQDYVNLMMLQHLFLLCDDADTYPDDYLRKRMVALIQVMQKEQEAALKPQERASGTSVGVGGAFTSTVVQGG